MSNKVAIELKNIGKKYNVTHQEPFLVKIALSRKPRRDFWALRNVSLTINQGDRVGIIGSNGAGKTTLLKIIAGITKPSTGAVKTNGKVVSLIDLEAGFHPELTGEENILINGMLVKMSRQEIENKREKIIRFADIGEFINAPFHTYSSGMKFRLAFAVAIASNCEIVLIDEIFLVGDMQFQYKIFKLLKEIKNHSKKTYVITSHIPALIWGLTDTFFKLDRGKATPFATNKMATEVKKYDKYWKETFNIG
jgi:ABC-type polysaccharide/polyol phosphate transport system ATPase subunit